MLLEEFALRHKTNVSPEVLFAGKILEARGEKFGVTFDLGNAIDRAASVLVMFIYDYDWWKDEYGFR